MASKLPKPEFAKAGDAGKRWGPKHEIRKHREIMVPDTIEWTGKRPQGEGRRFGPIEIPTPGGAILRLTCIDRPGKSARTLSVSLCSMLETPTTPFAEHAWDAAEVAESYADEHLAGKYEISRVDFARDLWVPGSEELIRSAVRRLAGTRLVDTYCRLSSLGLTLFDVEGFDRVRIYHKGLETKHKHQFVTMPGGLENVIRVEAQLRRGQLEDELRRSVRDLQTRRLPAGPDEHAPQVMRLRPQPGKGIRKRHLHPMNRSWAPRKAVEVTTLIDSVLREIGLEGLVPGPMIPCLVDPRYGKTSPATRRR